MTSISTSLSSYYQLFGQQSSATNTTSASLTQSLADALDALSSSGSGSGAYSLNLSPAAQALMNGGSSGSGTGSSTTFTLTSAQQADIKTILEKYKDAPYTQATFDSIQSDLSAAGLGAPQLSAEDQVNSFNSTDVFLSALSGNYSSLNTPSQSATSEQTKTANYMNDIISAWQSISTTYSASADTQENA